MGWGAHGMGGHGMGARGHGMGGHEMEPVRMRLSIGCSSYSA